MQRCLSQLTLKIYGAQAVFILDKEILIISLQQ